VRALSARGIDVAVRFEDAAGMKVGSTHVLHRGLDVGTLTRLDLDTDGFHVVAHFDMDENMARYLTTGSRFYLEGAHPSFADPASLGAILSGPKIELVAGRGTPTRLCVS
jgi:paraquat-inducible protein B